MVDGVDRTNARTGTATAITRPTRAAPKSSCRTSSRTVQVKQSGWNAEYRAALGGVVNAVTKSGSNSFHGSGGHLLHRQRLARRHSPDASRAADRRGGGRVRPDPPRQEPPDRRGGSRWAARSSRTRAGSSSATRRSSTRPSARSRGRTPARSRRRRRSTTASRTTRPSTTTSTSQLAELAAGAFHRQQRDAEGRPRRFRPSNRTAPARRAPRPSTRAPRCSPSSSQNAYSGIVDWVRDQKTFVNVTVSYLGYGSAQRRRRLPPRHAPHVRHARTSAWLDVPANLQNVNGFADNNSNSFTVADDYQRFNLVAGRDPVRALEGRPRLQDRRVVRAHRQLREPGPAARRTSPSTGAALSRLPNGFARTGKYGYFVASRQITRAATSRRPTSASSRRISGRSTTS